MKIFHATAKSDAGADEKYDINFYWPKASLTMQGDYYIYLR